MRASCLTAMVIATVLGTAHPNRADAQTLEAPRARQGYYVSGGLLGFANLQWNDGATDGWRGGSGDVIRLGQMLTSRFGLGLRIDVGGAKSGSKTYATGGLGVEAQVNVWRDLAIQAGGGLGFTSLSDPKSLEEETKGGFGSVYTVGASYDIFFTRRLTGGWAVSPAVLVRWLPSDSLSGLWLCGGVQIAWWSGRPRNELVLPDNEAYKR